MSVKTYKFYMFEVWLNIISMECVSMGFFNLCPPSKNGHKKASKGEMNRSISLIY